MELSYYQVDAFSSKVFFGNPAGVCPLGQWIEPGLMQLVAAENNLSETAFFVKKGNKFEMRWFTPQAEIDLCGHATLAAAHVIFEFMDYQGERIEFSTMSGPLFVQRDGDLLSMDFPLWEPRTVPIPGKLVQALGQKPKELYGTRDLLAVYEDPEDVVTLNPDMRQLAKVDACCIVATAPGVDYDFISRVFAPAMGIPEDAVTGSAHCTLTPYWSKRLKKNRLKAFQASSRGGELFCECAEDRVKIAGHAACYLRGTITI